MVQLGKVVAFPVDLSSPWQPGAGAWLCLPSVGSGWAPGASRQGEPWPLVLEQELGRRVLPPRQPATESPCPCRPSASVPLLV